MAENKKGFILYADQRSIIDMLDNETAGILFKHIFSYVNDENPNTDNQLLKLAFEPIKLQLKRDLKHWESIRLKRSEAGKASANKRQQVLTSVESVEQISTNPTVIVKDKVIVKDINNNSVLDVWFSDLENSTLIDRIAMDYKLTSVKVKAMLKEFKPKMDVSYRTYADLANHFKNWVPKNLPKQTTKRTPLT